MVQDVWYSCVSQKQYWQHCCFSWCYIFSSMGFSSTSLLCVEVFSTRYNFWQKKQKRAWLMTHACKAKVKSIGFLFICPAGSSVIQYRWMHNFNKLKLFYEQHGHCNITPSHDVAKSLVVWVRSQRHALSCPSLLNDVKLCRRNLLKSINFMWHIYNK